MATAAQWEPWGTWRPGICPRDGGPEQEHLPFDAEVRRYDRRTIGQADDVVDQDADALQEKVALPEGAGRVAG